MDSIYNVRTLMKWLVFVYTCILIVIVHKVHQERFDHEIENNKVLTSNPSIHLKNTTNIVFINKTQSLYTNKLKTKYGPGENGTGVLFPKNKFTDKELTAIEANRKAHGFNTYISDVVSLQRRVKDMRPSKCKAVVYPVNLPPASVVIIFRDEWWSILLRTAYSVLEHSPPALVKEVILVDDGSVNVDLKRRVDMHVSVVDKFRLVRLETPQGLMMARQAGIEAVTSDYFIVLDGHMEVSPGWLEPLIHRLVQEPNVLLCSHVASILQDDLAIRGDDPEAKSPQFDQQFPFFDHINLDQMWAFFGDDYRMERNGSVEPIQYGTIQGMMAVMRKDFFLQLGGFDPGMKIWGSEQMELSVKVWLCGGSVEMIPCSKVFHMYRITPWGGLQTDGDYHSVNKARMIEVWMEGEQRDLLRDFLKDKKYETGDIQARIKIRNDNRCKPYQYYIDKLKSFSKVYIPEHIKARGPIHNAYYNKCLDFAKVNETYKVLAYWCHPSVQRNQYFMLTEDSQIRSAQGTILTVIYNPYKQPFLHVKISSSNWYSEDSKWVYTENGEIVHLSTGKCLTIENIQGEAVKIEDCIDLENQIWTWSKVN